MFKYFKKITVSVEKKLSNKMYNINEKLIDENKNLIRRNI